MRSIVIAIDGRLLERSVIPSTWPLVRGGFGLVSLCSMPCSLQMRSNIWPSIKRSVPFDSDRSANWMPLSVSTVWIL